MTVERQDVRCRRYVLPYGGALTGGAADAMSSVDGGVVVVMVTPSDIAASTTAGVVGWAVGCRPADIVPTRRDSDAARLGCEGQSLYRPRGRRAGAAACERSSTQKRTSEMCRPTFVQWQTD